MTEYPNNPWIEVGSEVVVEVGGYDDEPYREEFGRITALPGGELMGFVSPREREQGWALPAVVTTLTGEEIVAPLSQLIPILKERMPGADYAPCAEDTLPDLSETQWGALELARRYGDQREKFAGHRISKFAGVHKSSALVLQRLGLLVIRIEDDGLSPEGFKRYPSVYIWYGGITGLGRRILALREKPQAEAAAEEKREGYTKIPGLDLWVKDKDPEPEHTARRRRPKVQMTREGIPTGRYAIETAYGLEFFWVKLEGEKYMQHTTVRRLMDDGKWRMYYGGVREVIKLIKEAGWEAASRYGEAKKTCALCGQPLTVSAIKGIGPECADQVGENPFGPNN